MTIHAATPATGGDHYIAPQERDGGSSIVYFTRDLSADGLRKAFAKIADKLDGHVAIKLHTGEKDGPNIIPRPWVAELVEKDLPEAKIVETNTYYVGDRDTTEKHRETIAHNGWTFCPVDITDEDGYIEWPVEGGKWFDTMAVGANLANYDSMLTLTHFKGHMMGGFGGSNKNLGIGCASGKEGKKWIHAQTSDDGKTWGAQWSVANEELMEKITESTKATIDHFGDKIVYINVLRNMSVSCDCEGTAAQPVVTPNVGILVSTDICAIDSASVDLVVAMTDAGLVHNHDLVERMTSRHGFRQLEYMHELGMGNWRYTLLDLDNDEAEVSLTDAVSHVVPFAG
ncbi:MAG: DUF362 domain-containing protein [Atopobiaceae bacterium]|nr:DUF362 domain-containing protein [Atopobiaceae bacterium]